ncbi:putative ribonuclease H-like domain-containing protein [Tanacetum coccineum]|uniref:Ribonuclease H-like domain-containing protein n=1 Tax=Tanacetum coccineum TaxID=301880 RepID=A0ABQ4ZRP7_9ASTR
MTKNSVLFNDTECIVLSPNFKLTDESYVLLKLPRKNNMYSVDLKNIVPKGGLNCLFVKATSNESKLWHRRLGHINFKTMNKLVKGNLVRGLSSKLFKNDQTCVACQKGKQHRATFKSKSASSISQSLHMLHMDLFGPTVVKSLMKKMYFLVVAVDYSSVARTPQQNRVAERKNRTLIEAARIMLADSKLPTTFLTEAVNTACYVQNRVLVTKPHNKTPYELFIGRKPALGFMRPFGCPVTILYTIDHLGKFDGKADEGFFVGYSINSKSFRVFNSRTRIVEENLHVQFSENTPNITGSTKSCDDAGKTRMETVPGKDYILLPLWPADPLFSQSSRSSPDAGFEPSSDGEKKVDGDPRKEDDRDDQEKDDNVNNTNNVNTASDRNNTNNVNAVSSTVNAADIEVNVVGAKTSIELPDDLNMPELEDIVYSDDDEDVGAEADMNNLDAFMLVSPIPTTRVHKDHTVEQIIGDLNSAPQTRRMTKNLEEYGLFSSVQQRTNHKDFQNCLFACFLSQEEPKKVIHALKDPSWIEAMEDELLQFKLQKGLQVKQKEDGTFISQDKYVTEILKKLGFTDVKTASTPMETQKPLLKDEDACARYQVNPKVSHLHAVKRIFRYLKGQPKLGLWYPKDSPFDLVAYTDSDYARASLDRKSTTELQALVDGKKIIITELIVRRDLRLEDAKGVECLPNATIFEELTRTGPKRKDTEIPQSSVPSDHTNVADKAINEEPSMQLNELMDFYTKLQQIVLYLENTKTAQAMIIPIISKNRIFFPPNEASLGDQEDASKQGRKIDDIDADAEIYMCCCTQLTEDEITLAQALAELKSVKPKVTIATTTTTKGILLQKPSESITTTTTIPSKDKGKGSEVRVEIAEVAVCDAIPLATNASKLVTTRFLKRKDQLLSKIIRADWKFKSEESNQLRGRIVVIKRLLDDLRVYCCIVEYGVSTSIGYGVSRSLSNTAYSSQQINTTYPLPLDSTYRSSGTEAEIFDLRAKYYLFTGQILLIVHPLFQMVYKGNNIVGALMNMPIFVGTFSVMTDFAVLEDMDAYRDNEMGDIIFGEPFLREVGIKTKWFEGIITLYNGDNEVTYQMVRSHPKFKHHTNEQCNKIPPLLKVSEKDKINGISHAYQKLKGFYKGVLNLGPDFIRVPSMEEWLTRGHISVHELE